MKKLLSIILFFSLLNMGFGQDEWQKYTSENGVEIFTQEVNCYAKNIPDQVAILLKVVNTNNQRIKIEWDLSIWYNDEPSSENVSDGENHYEIELDANGEIVGDCEVPYGALYLYKDFITYKTETKLSRFELTNIKVTLL